MPKFSLEKVFEVWNDDAGWHYEIGPDRDGLGLIEIRYYDGHASGGPQHRMTFHHDEAKLIAAAILQCVQAAGASP